MQEFVPGQMIEIPCEVQPGAFATEMLVTFETKDGPISGFVRGEHVRQTTSGSGFISAIVKDVSPDTITVVVKGSYFTTTGLAYLERDWAKSHVQMAHA